MPAHSESMLSKNLTTGSSINASKLVGVLKMLASSGAMLAWYQDKPARVLNNIASSGAILGKRALVNATLGTCVNNKICLGQFFIVSLENGYKLDLESVI